MRVPVVRWRPSDRRVIFITAKFRVRSEHADEWADITKAFTEATRAETGNLWFEWSRSLDDPTKYVHVEAFRDGEAGAAHVASDHFAEATARLPAYLLETPRIVSQVIDQTDWSDLSWGRCGSIESLVLAVWDPSVPSRSCAMRCAIVSSVAAADLSPLTDI